ncbi:MULTISPECIES: hypothetical protein [Streptomyces rochei group]|uniref:hypothetical protein n=1 Tax=Streptomyces rochei group TaxID=2867164 RepID=UPI0018750FDF|nr:hypothetical protein [Streptomyces vinaceusdrappus]GHC28989.1 hypothetical protein GCM10010308_52890 [Streptomyces vinaceusdrappus]
MTVVVYDPEWWPHVNVTGQREELCKWLRANRIDPCDVPPDAAITIEAADSGCLIRYTAHLRNDSGHKYLDTATDTVAQEERTVPLVTDPPPHWPTKENDR